uniref:AMP-binding_C domain-containing protein n=1 Tax=Mesocestoides corti TaxID=53468 RepID=A0A5K3G330_MESCO
GNRLKIVDRLKNIFKLSQGEYVAPEKVEQVYSQTPLVNQVFVDGSPLRSYPVALVVPNGDALATALNSLYWSRMGAVNGNQKASRQSTSRVPGGDDGTSGKFWVRGKFVTLAELCNDAEAERII